MQESQTGAHPAIERIIKEVLAHVDARFDELEQKLTANFNPLHNETSRRIASVEKHLTSGIDLFDQWAASIQANTAYTKTLAVGAFASSCRTAPTPPVPADEDPRPPEIDRACSADPGDGVQRVDLPQYGSVAYILPGTDPETAWDGVKTSIRQQRGGADA